MAVQKKGRLESGPTRDIPAGKTEHVPARRDFLFQVSAKACCAHVNAPEGKVLAWSVLDANRVMHPVAILKLLTASPLWATFFSHN